MLPDSPGKYVVLGAPVSRHLSQKKKLHQQQEWTHNGIDHLEALLILRSMERKYDL